MVGVHCIKLFRLWIASGAAVRRETLFMPAHFSEYDGNLDNKESVCCEGFCFIMKFVTCSLHTGSYKTERKGFEG